MTTSAAKSSSPKSQTASSQAKAPAKRAGATKKAAATKAAAKGAPAEKAPASSTKAATAKKSSAKVSTKAGAKKPAAKAAAGGTDAHGAKKAPAKPAKAFDAKFLEAQHALLHEERRRLVHDADSLTAEANALAEGREPGDAQFDEESGEGDTLAVERERDLALSAQFRDQVDEIDRALAKFDGGTYGICEVSGTPIPKERLKAIPWARERVEYKVGGFGRR